MIEQRKVCKTCRYFQPVPSEVDPGWCRRYPQALDKFPSDWCGEWRSIEPEPDRAR